MLTLNLFLMGLFLSLSTAMAVHQPNSNLVIYGDDDRVEPYTVTDRKLKKISRSVAAMVSPYSISLKPVDQVSTPVSSSRSWGRGKSPEAQASEMTVKGYTLGEGGVYVRGYCEGGYCERQVCDSERFHDQLTIAGCTGFLVAEDILVTAGHCVLTNEDCKSTRWVFGFEVEESGSIAKMTSDDLYECKEIIGRDLGDFRKDKVNYHDYAVLRLNKKVKGRTPIKINKTGKPVIGDEVAVLGHPSGLPQKIAAGAEVKKLDNNYFYANLDTYGGNSGSPVINLRTYEVEGIVVIGNDDYTSSDPLAYSSCAVSAVLPDETVQAEIASNISQIFPTLETIKNK